MPHDSSPLDHHHDYFPKIASSHEDPSERRGGLSSVDLGLLIKKLVRCGRKDIGGESMTRIFGVRSCKALACQECSPFEHFCGFQAEFTAITR